MLLDPNVLHCFGLDPLVIDSYSPPCFSPTAADPTPATASLAFVYLFYPPRAQPSRGSTSLTPDPTSLDHRSASWPPRRPSASACSPSSSRRLRSWPAPGRLPCTSTAASASPIRATPSSSTPAARASMRRLRPTPPRRMTRTPPPPPRPMPSSGNVLAS
jgi:hypothetical protein